MTDKKKNKPAQESRYRQHALAEFIAAGWIDESGTFKDMMQASICQHVLKLLGVFAAEGHSGTSAPYAVQLFEKLAMFEPIAPLTGAADEWVEYAEGRFQNRRCSHVFKDSPDGQAYDSEGKIFVEVNADGHKVSFTSIDSRVPVTFPYTPTREYVESPKVKP